MAGIGLQLTLIYIFCAELACPLRRALAVVSIDTIHTGPPIETPMSRTVIHIDFTVLALKARKASTVIGDITTLPTGATITTRGRGTGHYGVLTQQPCIAEWTLAVEGSGCIDAGATMAARCTGSALVYVASAVATLVARWAGTGKSAIRPDRAGGTVSAGAAEAGVWQGAVWASEATGTATGEPGDACHH